MTDTGIRCRRCHYMLVGFKGPNGYMEYAVVSNDTADGLTYCPPNPDRDKVGKHAPARRSK